MQRRPVEPVTVLRPVLKRYAAGRASIAKVLQEIDRWGEGQEVDKRE